MVSGFNHNVRYKGENFHIQTEDGGTGNPFITTLLYLGGAIIASKKTGYSDIIKADMLESVVEELMKEQHKEMLRRLKAGEFDARAFFGAPPSDSGQQPQEPPPTAADPGHSPAPILTIDEIILDYLASDENR